MTNMRDITIYDIKTLMEIDIADFSTKVYNGSGQNTGKRKFR